MFFHSTYTHTYFMIGTVRLFNDIIGSGFIDPDDGSPSVRVSYRSISRDGYKILHEGQKVWFEIEMTPKGPLAVEVRTE